MLSYRNMRGVAWGIAERLEMDARSVHLSYLPLCHVAEQMLSTFVPIYVGSQVNFGESIRTVQEDLREVAPSIFLGVPRIWEKLHAAISIKMQEAGRLQQWLYRRALAACAPFLEKSRAQYGWRERWTHALWYWLVLRALQNIGLRRVAGGDDRRGADSAGRGALLPQHRRAAAGGLWPDRVLRHDLRPAS